MGLLRAVRRVAPLIAAGAAAGYLLRRHGLLRRPGRPALPWPPGPAAPRMEGPVPLGPDREPQPPAAAAPAPDDRQEPPPSEAPAVDVEAGGEEVPVATTGPPGAEPEAAVAEAQPGMPQAAPEPEDMAEAGSVGEAQDEAHPAGLAEPEAGVAEPLEAPFGPEEVAAGEQVAAAEEIAEAEEVAGPEEVAAAEQVAAAEAEEVTGTEEIAEVEEVAEAEEVAEPEEEIAEAEDVAEAEEVAEVEEVAEAEDVAEPEEAPAAGPYAQAEGEWRPAPDPRAADVNVVVDDLLLAGGPSARRDEVFEADVIEDAEPQSDAAVAEAVRVTLAERPGLLSGAFDVEVKGGTVYLRGQVEHAEAIPELERRAAAVHGVHQVQSRLRLSGGTPPVDKAR